MLNEDGIRRSRRNVTMAAAVALAAFLGVATRPGKARAAGGFFGGRCFLRGTKIRTPGGYCRIEELSPGDVVQAHLGGVSRIRAIHRTELRRSSAEVTWQRRLLPVRIARSALADGVPRADLYLTGAHSLFLEGVLIPVGDLINDVTIARVEAADLEVLEYFHIKLDRHDVIDAQGVLCETLRADGMPACAPHLSFNGGRSELKSRLRSALSPWIERREKLDLVRDALDERAAGLGDTP